MQSPPVSAPEANHDFSELLSRVERAEQILITKRSKPVGLLSPYHPPRLTPERQAAIEHAINVMAQGLPWGAAVRAFTQNARAMMVSFDTNILVYATVSAPLVKTQRARDLLLRECGRDRASAAATLAEDSSVAIRKVGIEVNAVRTTIDAWRAVLHSG